METLLIARRNDLNELLEAVCESIQLTKVRFDEATGHYEVVSAWLSDTNSFLRVGQPLIYPYGSMALHTEVKPIKRDEFDLDQICLIARTAEIPTSSVALFDAVVRRLLEHEGLKDRLEINPPAIRLKYADAFRLEVVPARPALQVLHPTAIEIVDYKSDSWILSDPKAYIEWFDAKSKVVTEEERMTKAAASYEAPPEHAAATERRTLARAVQLFKRRRDRFYGAHQMPPTSIILTTLAGESYSGSAVCYEALRDILALV